MTDTITVVLPTLNRETFLLSTIDDLLKQTKSPDEILIVDQSDKPSARVQELAAKNREKISYYHVQFRGLPLARNYGWQKARGSVVLYLDDDIRCSRELVQEHMRSMSDPSVGMVGGGIDEANKQEDPDPKLVGTFSYWTATPKRGFQSKRQLEVQHVPGGNFSVRRELVRKVGGFDEWLSQGAALYEETDFSLRFAHDGHKIVFNPKARITHLAAATGGCRVPELPRYLRTMSRNRMAIILRYLKWYHRPVAFVRLLLLNLSYVRSQRDPKALGPGLKGLIEGFASPSRPVVTPHL